MRALLVVLVACSAPSRSQPPAQPKPLAPADVGLPDEPIRDVSMASPAYVPRPGPSGYLRNEECPPDHRGCWVEQEVTDEHVRVRWRCRGSSSSFVGGRALRRLTSKLEIGDGGIEPREARRALLRADRAIHRCFDLDGIVQHAELHFTIHQGRAIDLEASGCVREALKRVDLPIEPSFTPVHWTFDYAIDDPAAVPRLQC